MSALPALTAILLLSAAFHGCAELPVPRGYVPLDHPQDQAVLHCVASNGNRYQVREHPNPEGATLEFWVDAIRRELVGARGAEVIDEGSLTTQGGARGAELLLRCRHQLDEYLYLVAVFVDHGQFGEDDRVVVCEGGGLEDSFQADLEAVRTAIVQLDIDAP